jgi:hypothetical protein
MIYKTPKLLPMSELSPLIVGLIDSGTDVSFTVIGDSMQPLVYHCRDSVILTRCDPETLKKGQITLYIRPNGKYVLHRIVKVKDKTFNMCGDHQYTVEKNVKKTAVLCVVKGFTRNGKTHSCDEFFYKLYSDLWVLLLPVRRYIITLYRLPKKLLPKKIK